MLLPLRLSLVLLTFITSSNLITAKSKNAVFIRANQVGFLLHDLKTAVVFSEFPFSQKKFSIVEGVSNKAVYSGTFDDTAYTYGKFKYCYTLDFSNLQKPGIYKIEVGGYFSFPFRIGKYIYNPVVDSLMLFFKEQRCGPTHPILHSPCHLSDAARIEGDSEHIGGADLTGGWHDAGDYIKFLSTAAYTTYMLMFSYEFDKTKFGFDNNKNGVPDVLEEAKIGIDWLLRCNYSKYKLITQVQDVRDHSVGWRMPENDSLQYDRAGIAGIGKNQIGIYCAVMATAYRIWSEKFSETNFAEKCLNAAENLYSIRNKVPDIDTSTSGYYRDNEYLGKLALGAIELYSATKKFGYFNDAITYCDSAGSDYWWSYGNINALADYRIAETVPRFSKYILNNLKSFDIRMDTTLFGEGLPYSWGSTNGFLGAALQAILYRKLTGSSRFDSLAVIQRDYVLGRNPWGLGFIYNIGTRFPLHLHSQVAYFHNGYLPGALSAGPAPETVLKNYKIINKDHRYDLFNTSSVSYFDDIRNYITNEPTITGNATAVFVYGFYSDR